jgi:hypothetical protein
LEARSVGDNVSDSFLPSLSLSLSPTLHSPSTRRAAPAIAKGQRQLAELENAAARHTFQGRERRMQTTARTIQSKLNSTVSLFHSRAAFTPATRAREREREAIRISAPVAAAAAFNEHTERTRQLAFQGERKKVKENQRSRKKKNQKITLKNHSVVISKNKKDTLCSFGCSPGVPSRIDPHDAALERLLRRRARKSER